MGSGINERGMRVVQGRQVIKRAKGECAVSQHLAGRKA